MTSWITHKDGSRTFNHEGWTVTITSPDFYSQISVRSPHFPAEDVDITSEGARVYGENDSCDSWSGTPRAFTIPWPVLVAIVEARAIVG